MQLRRITGVVILAICIGGPIVETFDHWDRTPYGGDTEGNLVVAALCIGVALAVATKVVVARLRSSFFTCSLDTRPSPPRPFLDVPVQLLRPIPTTSPPTPLRI